jgi:hypothetical protein
MKVLPRRRGSFFLIVTESESAFSWLLFLSVSLFISLFASQERQNLPLRYRMAKNVVKPQPIHLKKLSVLHKRVLNRGKAVPRINCVAPQKYDVCQIFFLPCARPERAEKPESLERHYGA